MNFLCNGSSHGGGSVHRVGSGPHVFPTCWANPWLVRCGCWILLLSILTGREERLRSVSGSQFEAAYRLGPRGTWTFDTYLGAENGQHYLRRSSKSFIQSRGWNHEIWVTHQSALSEAFLEGLRQAHGDLKLPQGPPSAQPGG